MKEQKYVIKNISSFELVDIFDCGQCFRWNKQQDGSYTGTFKGNVMNVQKQGNTVTFKGICNGDIKEIVEDYFDLNRNYEEIKQQLSKIDNHVKTSIEYGQGIRILNQDLFEMIISYIISAKKNIPSIKLIIDRICKNYGKKIEWNGKKYYTFPTPEELKDATIEDYRRLGAGFRDIRLYETVHMVLDKKVDLNKMQNNPNTLEVKE